MVEGYPSKGRFDKGGDRKRLRRPKRPAPMPLQNFLCLPFSILTVRQTLINKIIDIQVGIC